MLTVEVFLRGNLADLPPRRWLTAPDGSDEPPSLVRRLKGPTTVKDLLEAAGIPHCEIGEVCRGGSSLELSHLIEYGCRLEVVPAPPRALEHPRFICDQHLGALARLLRIMGFDTTWKGDWLEPEIARRALNEQRTVLSRSRSLLKRKALSRAQLIRSDEPDRQVAEVVDRFRLAGQARLFGRCTVCNGPVVPVPKADVQQRIPPRTARWLDDYFLCRDCGQLYWEGTHVLALKARLASLLESHGGDVM